MVYKGFENIYNLMHCSPVPSNVTNVVRKKRCIRILSEEVSI